MMRFDPDSEAPELGGLWERIHRAVVELRGAGSTVWNGRVDLLPRGESPHTTGGAEAGGRIRLSRTTVDALARLHAAGPDLLRDDLAAATSRRALTAAAHEFGHLTGPPGYTVEDWDREVAKHPELSIEESFEEAQTRLRLDELIDRVMPPAFAKRLRAARDTHPDPGLGSYPGGVDAVAGFAFRVRLETGIDPRELVATAARSPASGKAAAIAGLLVRQGLDPAVVPERRLARVTAKVAATIEEGFARIDPGRTGRGHDPRRLGDQLAGRSLAVIDQARRRSTGPGPAVSWLREAGHVLDGLTHPSARRSETGRTATVGQPAGRDRVAGPKQPRPGPRGWGR